MEGTALTTITNGLQAIATVLEDNAMKYLYQRKEELLRSVKPVTLWHIGWQDWAVNPCQATFDKL